MTDQLALDGEDSASPARGSRTVAWDDRATRRAWRRQTGRSLLALTGCGIGWAVYIGVLIPLPDQLVWPCVAFVLYSVVRVPLALLAELPNSLRVRRVLRGHAWQLAQDPPHGRSDHPRTRDANGAWFEVPDPARPDTPQLVVLGSAPLWWGRRMRADAAPGRKEQLGVLWYAGDRDGDMVVAASRRTEKAPRRMLFRSQRDVLVPAQRGESPQPPSLPAFDHPPTRRTARRYLRRWLLLVAVGPPVMCAAVITVTVTDVGPKATGWVVVTAIMLTLSLPLQIRAVASARRRIRILSEHRWRLVDCEIRHVGKVQLVTIDGHVLFPKATLASVDSRSAQLWLAGHPSRRCVLSSPGGRTPAVWDPAPAHYVHHGQPTP